jgi:hypothetical protein
MIPAAFFKAASATPVISATRAGGYCAAAAA